LPSSVVRVWKTDSSHQFVPVRKKAAGNGLTPYPSNSASSTVSVPPSVVLADEAEVDELVVMELVADEVEDDVVAVLIGDDVETVDDEETDVVGVEVELTLLVVVVVVDGFADKASAAAPATTMIITITIATIALLIADTFTTLFFILERSYLLSRECSVVI
jgi:hypothetical protein